MPQFHFNASESGDLRFSPLLVMFAAKHPALYCFATNFTPAFEFMSPFKIAGLADGVRVGVVFRHRIFATWTQLYQMFLAIFLPPMFGAQPQRPLASTAKRTFPAMQLKMFCAVAAKNQILNSVVRLDLVNVMNFLTLGKQSSNVFLHHKPMLKNIPRSVGVGVVAGENKDISAAVSGFTAGPVAVPDTSVSVKFFHYRKCNTRCCYGNPN